MPIHFQIDTGASVSIIYDIFWKLLKFKLHVTDNHLFCCNRNKIPNIGKINIIVSYQTKVNQSYIFVK